MKADSQAHKVRVAYRPERIGLHEIEEAVTSLGFRVRQAQLPAAEERVGPER